MIVLLFKPKIKFEPRDAWVGVYWKKRASFLSVYVCIIPFFPLVTHWRFGRKRRKVEGENFSGYDENERPTG